MYLIAVLTSKEYKVVVLLDLERLDLRLGYDDLGIAPVLVLLGLDVAEGA